MPGRIVALVLAAIAVASLLFLRFGPSPAPLPAATPGLTSVSPAGVTSLWLYRPATGQWLESDEGEPRVIGPIAPADSVPVLVAFERRARPLAWRASTGTWVGAGPRSIRWGMVGDAPWPGSYGGTPALDLAMFRAANGTWLIRDDSGETRSVAFGRPGDVAVPADYDGDGRTDLGVWRPSTGTWYWRSVDGSASGSQAWGTTGDMPLAGNYVGSPRADFVVFRPSTGEWLRRDGETGRASGITWGRQGDVPVPVDRDANGRLDLVVWRPSTATWYIRPDALDTPVIVQFGQRGDVPLPLHPSLLGSGR